MAQIINDAQAEVVIVGPEFVPHVEKIEAELETVTTIVAIGGHDRWRDLRGLGRRSPTDRSRVVSSRRRRRVPALHVGHDRVCPRA